MTTRIEEIEGKLVAFLDGELDTAAAPETEQALQPLKECDDKDIVLDCADLKYIASSGMRVFFGILKSAKAKGHVVEVHNLNDGIRNVFKMTGFDKMFEIK